MRVPDTTALKKPEEVAVLLDEIVNRQSAFSGGHSVHVCRGQHNYYMIERASDGQTRC